MSNTAHRLGGRNILRAGVAAAAMLAAAAPATAEPPMWVVEDEDSTLYLFGTVHLLDPDIEWRTEQVMDALDEATEIWFETPLPATMEEVQAQQAPLMLTRAMSPERPLSSLLTEEEKAQLERALARTPAPEQLGAALEQMRPWFATVTLGVAPMMAAGYETAAGADFVLAGLAHAQGDAVRGFETLEQQIELLAGGTEEEQLAALRLFLSLSDEEFEAYLAEADAGFRAWMAGDTGPLDAIMAEWRANEGAMAAALRYDVMVAQRNVDWAAQIEELLAGEGVAFIAVGAGHLLGPDSVLAQLAQRGITAERR